MNLESPVRKKDKEKEKALGLQMCIYHSEVDFGTETVGLLMNYVLLQKYLKGLQKKKITKI